MKSGKGLSLREIADTPRRASAPPAVATARDSAAGPGERSYNN